jgi:hypothetical protein
MFDIKDPLLPTTPKSERTPFYEGRSYLDKAREMKSIAGARQLLKNIELNPIDLETQGEIKALLEAGSLGRAQNIYKEARLGTAMKYKARVGAQKMFETLLDRPGSAQTRDSGIASLLTGNAFIGRGR